MLIEQKKIIEKGINMTIPKFISEYGINVSAPYMRKLIINKSEELSNKGAIIIQKNEIRKSYKIINPNKLLEIIS